MESRARAGFLMGGSGFALLWLAFPGLYGIDYSPPAHSAAAAVDLTKLKDFKGTVSSPTGGVFNGFSGPADFHGAFIAICVMFGIGLLVMVTGIDIEDAVGLAKVLKLGDIGAKIFVVATFIWGFFFNHTPNEIRATFVRDLGGGPAAVADSKYLTASLGLGTLLLFFGLLVGFIGISPAGGCALVSLFVLSFIGLIIYASVAGKDSHSTPPSGVSASPSASAAHHAVPKPKPKPKPKPAAHSTTRRPA
ncbi:hypothetical protein ACEZCY_04870 [Streptacidiphilus sp. N1-12]|uniref:Uncharacterized protein n=2 Tax=Streptacidiphilus alkalitolerans TaxID=3342712 RepID=A0ABV6XE62_9ACTN